MLIVFGTRFCGKIATVNNQWVESKFFSIMFVPIFPVSSMFVTGSEFRKRKGFAMEANMKSIKAVYGRVLSLFFAIWFFFLAFSNSSFLGYGGMKISLTYLLLAFLMITSCVYFYFRYGNSNFQDISLRNKVGLLTGYYALPHWFNNSQLNNTYRAFELKYKLKYPGSDWKTDLQSNTIDQDKNSLLFGLALFNCMIDDSPENDELYVKADQLFLLKSASILY